MLGTDFVKKNRSPLTQHLFPSIYPVCKNKNKQTSKKKKKQVKKYFRKEAGRAVA
jgi:hypothetical protein